LRLLFISRLHYQAPSGEIPIDSRKAIETRQRLLTARFIDGPREIPIDSRKAIETQRRGCFARDPHQAGEIPIDSRKAIETNVAGHLKVPV